MKTESGFSETPLYGNGLKLGSRCTKLKNFPNLRYTHIEVKERGRMGLIFGRINFFVNNISKRSWRYNGALLPANEENMSQKI